MEKVRGYYQEYHGHRISDLITVESNLRQLKSPSSTSNSEQEQQQPCLIFLAGDSSLDNKFWFHERGPATNGYEQFLDPPLSKLDVCHWINQLIAEERGLSKSMACINCAIEESSVGQRARGRLLGQDHFLRDHVQKGDVVVVSVGGNDIALRPALTTIVNMLLLICCTSNSCLEMSTCGTALPCDDPCCGCTTGCFSSCTAFPPGYGYFLHLFGVRIQNYVERLTGGKYRPKKVLICMIYYPDEAAGGSWADPVLAMLGYNGNPQKLQLLIRRIFEHATSTIKVPGTEVVAVPLFATLNGKNTDDYSQRVEPSASGGKKMARLILDCILEGKPAVDRVLRSQRAMDRL